VEERGLWLYLARVFGFDVENLQNTHLAGDFSRGQRRQQLHYARAHVIEQVVDNLVGQSANGEIKIPIELEPDI
jgi:hypothetical protein